MGQIEVEIWLWFMYEQDTGAWHTSRDICQGLKVQRNDRATLRALADCVARGVVQRKIIQRGLKTSNKLGNRRYYRISPKKIGHIRQTYASAFSQDFVKFREHLNTYMGGNNFG